jgi:hypothetical protein
MTLKFKLNLQQFGNPENDLDKLDSKDDGFYTIVRDGVTYNIPTSILNLGVTSDIAIGNAEKVTATNAFIQYYINNNGANLTKSGFDEFARDNLDVTLSTGQLNIVYNTFDNPGFLQQLQNIVTTSKTTSTSTIPAGAENQVSAFNNYYNDIYSLKEGTGGAEMLSRLEQSYANQAQQAATMADVGFQQAALQQASTVKQITDQVRGERLARLRSGMSESQIANQDMQMLMTNVNTLNQNAQMLNQGRLEAQIGINTAQDQAYADFLTQANQKGQVGAAMAASDAGDTYQQTIKQMSLLYGSDPSKWTGTQWTETSNRVATGNIAGVTTPR